MVYPGRVIFHNTMRTTLQQSPGFSFKMLLGACLVCVGLVGLVTTGYFFLSSPVAENVDSLSSVNTDGGGRSAPNVFLPSKPSPAPVVDSSASNSISSTVETIVSSTKINMRLLVIIAIAIISVVTILVAVYCLCCCGKVEEENGTITSASAFPVEDSTVEDGGIAPNEEEEEDEGFFSRMFRKIKWWHVVIFVIVVCMVLPRSGKSKTSGTTNNSPTKENAGLQDDKKNSIDPLHSALNEEEEEDANSAEEFEARNKIEEDRKKEEEDQRKKEEDREKEKEAQRKIWAAEREAEKREALRTTLNKDYLKLKNVDYSAMDGKCKKDPFPPCLLFDPSSNKLTPRFTSPGIWKTAENFRPVGEYLVALNEGVDFTESCPFDNMDLAACPALYFVVTRSEEDAKKIVVDRRMLLNRAIKQRCIDWLNSGSVLLVSLIGGFDSWHERIMKNYMNALAKLDPADEDNFIPQFRQSREQFFEAWKWVYSQNGRDNYLPNLCLEDFKQKVLN